MSRKFLENAWYVATWSDEVGQALFERTIIGRSRVFFRNQDGIAVAFDNHCPHRSAPLHLGKQHDDVFECPYHGLRFNHDGGCVYNPHGHQKIPRRAHPKISDDRKTRDVMDLDGRSSLRRRSLPDGQGRDRDARVL